MSIAMAQHVFTYEGSWQGDRSGQGEISVGGLQSVVTTPAQMGGPGQGTNPDEMLLGAAATCYMMTLAFALASRKVPYERLRVSSTATFNDEGGLHCERIVHKPHVVLPSNASDADVAKVHDLVKLAESRCMVSKALMGNVEILVEARVDRE